MTVRIPLAVLALSALLVSACKESPSDVAFGKRVHDYLMAHPEVIREAAIELDKKEARQAEQAAVKALASNRKEIENDPRDFVLNPNGKVTVVQFLDYNCTYCKVAAPQVLDLIARNRDVRFVFKELPVIGGAPSQRAARVALAVHKRGGDYLSLYRDFIAARPLDNEAIDRIVAQHGLDVATLEIEAVKAGFPRYLDETVELSQKLQISGTPSYVVGDKLIVGGDIPGLARAIAEARKA